MVGILLRKVPSAGCETECDENGWTARAGRGDEDGKSCLLDDERDEEEDDDDGKGLGSRVIGVIILMLK